MVDVLRGNRDESSIQVNNANIFCYVGRSIQGKELVFFFIFTISIHFVYLFLSLNDFLRGKINHTRPPLKHAQIHDKTPFLDSPIVAIEL